MTAATYVPTYADLLVENAALRARLARESKWVAPANANEAEPDGHERRFGAFTASAWPDGYWAIYFGRPSSPRSSLLRECKLDERCDSLDQAKAAVEGVMCNLLADAASGFGEAL